MSMSSLPRTDNCSKTICNIVVININYQFDSQSKRPESGQLKAPEDLSLIHMVGNSYKLPSDFHVHAIAHAWVSLSTQSILSSKRTSQGRLTLSLGTDVGIYILFFSQFVTV